MIKITEDKILTAKSQKFIDYNKNFEIKFNNDKTGFYRSPDMHVFFKWKIKNGYILLNSEKGAQVILLNFEDNDILFIEIAQIVNNKKTNIVTYKLEKIQEKVIFKHFDKQEKIAYIATFATISIIIALIFIFINPLQSQTINLIILFGTPYLARDYIKLVSDFIFTNFTSKLF
mgnify:CR=1 FL=1